MTNDKENKTNRKRGRPTGASKFAKSDFLILEKVADKLIQEPNMNRTKLYRDYGLKTESEFHRLNRKWNSKKENLLKKARQRRDANAELGWLGKIVQCHAFLGDWAVRIIRSTPGKDLEKLAKAVIEDINKGTRKANAQKNEQGAPKPPFNVDNPAEVSAAVDRFVDRPIKTNEDLIEKFDPSLTYRELPQWLQFEAKSILFHELALQAKVALDRSSAQTNPASGGKTKTENEGDEL